MTLSVNFAKRFIAVLALLSGILFLLELNGILVIGNWINRFWPCEQPTDPITSFPCQYIWDVYFMVGLLGIFVISCGGMVIYKFHTNGRLSSEHLNLLA